MLPVSATTTSGLAAARTVYAQVPLLAGKQLVQKKALVDMAPSTEARPPAPASEDDTRGQLVDILV